VTDRRWIAQRPRGEFMHMDVPIEGEPVDELSGAGALAFTLRPEMIGLEHSDGGLMFEPWATALYLEEAGQIRWGGLVVDGGWDGPAWSVECAGFSTYAWGQPFDGELKEVNVDPADVWRAIWSHLQGYPDGALGIEVVGSTSARVGKDAEEPYELAWFDNPDCGRELERLATEAPFEWIEEHFWTDASKTQIGHRIRIADRIGRRLTDLRFAQDENVDVVPFDQDGEGYASELLGIGRGEGKKALRSRVAVQHPRRLRRARLVDSTKDIGSQARLDAVVRAEHRGRSARLTTAQIIVREHPNAPLGSFAPGDEIRVDADAAWLGWTSTYQRIVSRQRVSATSVLLDLEPA